MLEAVLLVIGNHLELLDDVIVVGNGESRLSIDLKQLLLKIKSVGCNAIYRDYSVDHLICVDRRMVKEAKPFHNNIYTRKDWNQPFNIKAVPDIPYHGDKRQDDPFNWGSGPYAVLLASTLSKSIHMIGFDLYSKDRKINNVYKGTDNYDKIDKSAIDHSYWVYQISKVFELNSDKYFTIYNEPDWKMPKEWQLKNVFFKSIDKLLS